MQPIHFRDSITARLVQSAATDLGVYHAARVSTIGENSAILEWGGEAPNPERLAGLIGYLIRSGHASPFEHNLFTFFVEAPIFVFRELVRHRIGFSFNEASGRYREFQPVFYAPGPDRKLCQVGKAGHYTFVPGTPAQASLAQEQIRAASVEAFARYRTLLEQGIAREVARMVLPVNVFSSMYISCNARSLMHFLELRTHRPDAARPSFPQREIEMVAEQLEVEAARLMPVSFAAFNQYGRVAP